ncbi:MAG: DNA-binding protein [Candidatus Berkelbacteria bacterium]|nr:DNA-binding protein [Candidatus Berkelbacteria bacterium]
MQTHIFRLRPGLNFKEEIDKYVQERKILAGIVLTCVGNLKKAVLRMANAKIIKTWEGSFEIVSLVGTVGAGNSHIHICLSSEDGKTFGGHLKNGSIVGTTAEVVIGEIENLEFVREFDGETGYKELVARSKKRQKPTKKK